jgi:hypothetical protein
MPLHLTRERPVDLHQPQATCVCQGTGLRDPGNPDEGLCPLCGRGAVLRARLLATKRAHATGVPHPASRRGKPGDAPTLNTAGSAELGGRGPDLTTTQEAP